MSFRDSIAQAIQSADFVVSLIGAEPRSIAPLEGGEISAVYRVVLTDGTSCVLKFAEDADELRQEQRFLAAWSAHGVHTPRVLQYIPLLDSQSPDRQLLDEAGGAALLMEYVPGQNLLPLVNSGAVEAATVMTDLGRILATMHQVTAHGYGLVQPAPEGKIRGVDVTLRDSLRSQEWTEAINANVHNGDLRASETQLIDRACTILSQHWDKPGGALVHGDFRAGNVLYNDALAQPYTVIDPHPELSHPYLCLAYSLILPEIYGNEDHSGYIRLGYASIAPVDDDALHAALFLRALALLPRWGQPDRHIAPPLRRLFRQQKARLLR